MTLTLALLAFLGLPQDKQDPPVVEMTVPGFKVRRLPVKLSNINNLEYLSDGTLLALGYDGRVHRLVDTDGDRLEDTARPYWVQGEGDLRAPIGMAVGKDGIYIASKGKISRLVDKDRDGQADACETVTAGWPEIPHGVDALGVALDEQDNLYFGLGCANFTNAYLLDKGGKSQYSLASERGTILKMGPDRKKREIVATGIRFPVGFAFNRHGDLFVTDQEGETWLPNGNPLDELLHVVPGKHYGFPPRHPAHLPGVIDEPAAVLFGPQHQSTCGMRFNEPRGVARPFGPALWEGDALVTGESRGKIWRVPMAKTAAGYIGTPVLIATLRMLTIDLALSPHGDLVVTCHSGPPDWGTGPKGEGAIFKISFEDKAAPQPVLAWPSGPMEIKVAFDRPIHPQAYPQAEIWGGSFVTPADRREVLQPPYKAVADQKRSPRTKVEVAGRRLSTDGRTMTLSTGPHPWHAPYAVRLAGAPDVDLAYSFSGLEATWTREGKFQPEWSGWIPHFDPEVIRALARGTVEHESLLSLLEQPGTLKLKGTLSLPDPKTPVRFDSNDAVRFDEASVPVLALEARTGKGFRLVGRFTAPFPPEDQPLRPENLIVPWAPPAVPPKPGPDPADPFKAGDWERGKALFFGEAKCSTCHTLRGAGARMGPDLTNLIHWSPSRILRETVEPNGAVNPDFVAYLLALKDGRRLSGLVFPQGQDQLKVVENETTSHLLRRSDVELIRPSAISLMPENYRQLGEEKLNDLVTFLGFDQQAAPPLRSRKEVDDALAGAAAPAKDPPPAQIVLVTGPKDHGPGEHDYPAFKDRWKELLSKAPGVTVTTAFKEPQEEHWKNATLMVFYFMDGPFWSEARLQAIDAYLARGGGLVLLHSACIPQKDAEKVAERIGLAWKPQKTKYRHGVVDYVLSDDPITRGLKEVRFIDESYWPLVGDPAQSKVLATVREEGEPRPVIWTATRGKGRVFGTLLGHYSWTFDDPLARILILRGMAWSASQPVERFHPLATDGVRLKD